MNEAQFERVQWRENPNAVDLGFEFYLWIIERRLRGERVSMVQSLLDYFQQELQINLRHTQARGLMHRDSSVFVDYAKAVSGQEFIPGVQHWEEAGLDSFLEWRNRFFMVRDAVAVDFYVGDEEDLRGEMQRSDGDGNTPPHRRMREDYRIVRDTGLSKFMKSTYDFQCQICSFSFRMPSGAQYAEAHHVRPLGGRHVGLDIESNMMVLCPTHHALMDFGTIAVHPESMAIITIDNRALEYGRRLSIVRHRINPEFLEYHLDEVYDKIH